MTGSQCKALGSAGVFRSTEHYRHLPPSRPPSGTGLWHMRGGSATMTVSVSTSGSVPAGMLATRSITRLRPHPHGLTGRCLYRGGRVGAWRPRPPISPHARSFPCFALTATGLRARRRSRMRSGSGRPRTGTSLIFAPRGGEWRAVRRELVSLQFQRDHELDVRARAIVVKGC